MFSSDPDQSSKTGWVYCLASPCKKFCKIGRTKRGKVSDRYPCMPVMTHSKYFDGRMIFSWAFPNWELEIDAHKALDKHRLNLTPDWRQEGTERALTPHYTCKKWLKSQKDKALYMTTTVEIFAISPTWAKKIIAQKIRPAIQ